MSIERVSRKVCVADFDDTTIGREKIIRYLALIGGTIHPHKLPNLTREDISNLDINHNRVEGHVKGWWEDKTFRVHRRRKILPGVRDKLARLVDQGVDIYGNTGRSNKSDWVDMTDETLQRGGVRNYFKEIFYTPEGTKTAVSKAHGLYLLLEQYDDLEFYDDDPRTTHFIAAMFPEIQVKLIQYRSTGLLVARRDLETLPNLKKITSFAKADYN